VGAHEDRPGEEPGEAAPRGQLTRVADPAHLAQDVVEVIAGGEVGHDACRVVRGLATDAPVRQLEGVHVRRGDEVRVDVHAAEIVDDHRRPAEHTPGEHTVDQGGLAGPEVAPDDAQSGAHGRVPACAASLEAWCRPPTTVPWTWIPPMRTGSTAS